ncbi:MAG: hypothetical protein FJ198_06890 [Gammaproteobacteria bacterium]|nr:hypothetical protein [Gammaproteobacteria bacterium]
MPHHFDRCNRALKSLSTLLVQGLEQVDHIFGEYVEIEFLDRITGQARLSTSKIDEWIESL